MNDQVEGGGVITTPLSLDELHALRTDYQDVPVPSLGGRQLRVYALTGTARGKLFADMASLVDGGSETDPATVREVFRFQSRAVAASLGYPEDQWDGVAGVLGSGAIEQLYDVVAELSGLADDAKPKAVRRLRPMRSAGSGSA